ncbi:MAG TPA: GntR family transcriptional regulator [Gemmatimonadaceae bacterium]|nr:GntR family transcriptional regulator [Gemmatimonadaceae bacterium]
MPLPSAHGELPGQMYERLRELIIRGRLPAGARAVEAEIAVRFGVSRTPVREALARLHHEGYLAAKNLGRRTQLIVAPLTIEQMRELWRVIGALEGLVIEFVSCLGAARRRQIARELEELNDALERVSAARPRNADDVFDAQIKFHERFISEYDGPVVLSLYRTVRPQVERYEWAYGAESEAELAPSAGEHRKIIDAVRSGDAHRARAAVEAHWANALTRTSAVISRILGKPRAP